LPARREVVAIHTADGLELVGELALPEDQPPKATVVLLHPLPTEGGSMDSHLFRKAAWRLPALTGLAVLRFNSRGTESSLGRSSGVFEGGVGERHDAEAALAWVLDHGLGSPWLVGWSFGSEVVLMHGATLPIEGAVLLSPPLKRTGSAHLLAWAASRKPLVALVPERDQFLPPAPAKLRFAMVSQAKVVPGKGFGHLWIGERAVHWALGNLAMSTGVTDMPLPETWLGPYQTYAKKETP